MTDWLNRCHIGDAREVLAQMVADGVKVQMCVTSPPYWGLRDYGTAIWEGGSADCDHIENRQPQNLAALADRMAPRKNPRNPTRQDDDRINAKPYRSVCGKCGAMRIDKQIGLEETPEEYVETLVDVFRLVREVLEDDGVIWVNLGDSYAGSHSGNSMRPEGGTQRPGGPGFQPLDERVPPRNGVVPAGLKPKDLVGIPWGVAFALQADGWYLRSDIIWSKPNPMPESVTDRPTKSHEYLFLLSKRERYFYDANAIAEPLVRPEESERKTPAKFGGALKHVEASKQSRLHSGNEYLGTATGTRNRRTVWTIPTEAFSEAHFATLPRGLVEPCILAGTSQKGHCPECGKRRRRVVNREFVPQPDVSLAKGVRGEGRQKPMDASNSWQGFPRGTTNTTTTAWEPTCSCGADPVPDVVLDPFFGSGTVGQVSQHLGRHFIGIDLNPHYTAMQTKRTAQRGLVLA